MNIFKKAYCRVFQTCFRIVHPLLPYKEPTIYESINDIPNILKDKNIKSVMLVTDKGIRSIGLTKNLEELLEQYDIKFIDLNEIPPKVSVKIDSNTYSNDIQINSNKTDHKAALGISILKHKEAKITHING